MASNSCLLFLTPISSWVIISGPGPSPKILGGGGGAQVPLRPCSYFYAHSQNFIMTIVSTLTLKIMLPYCPVCIYDPQSELLQSLDYASCSWVGWLGMRLLTIEWLCKVGVWLTLWVLFTCGSFPYSRIPVVSILKASKAGQRLNN